MTTGDRRGRLLERGQRWPSGDNHVHLETDQLGGEAGKALGLAFASTWLGYEMLSIH
jgi:hypothetical protein